MEKRQEVILDFKMVVLRWTDLKVNGLNDVLIGWPRSDGRTLTRPNWRKRVPTLPNFENSGNWYVPTPPRYSTHLMLGLPGLEEKTVVIKQNPTETLVDHTCYTHIHIGTRLNLSFLCTHMNTIHVLKYFTFLCVRGPNLVGLKSSVPNIGTLSMS